MTERKSIEPWHPFRSSAAREEYLAFYDERAQRWPIPSESMMVSTTFGDRWRTPDARRRTLRSPVSKRAIYGYGSRS